MSIFEIKSLNNLIDISVGAFSISATGKLVQIPARFIFDEDLIFSYIFSKSSSETSFTFPSNTSFPSRSPISLSPNSFAKSDVNENVLMTVLKTQSLVEEIYNGDNN